MDVLFRNKTKYSKNVYSDFLNFHLKTFRTKYFVFSISIILTLFILMIITAFYNFFNFSTVIAISIILFFIVRYVKPKKEVDKDMKSDSVVNEMQFDYAFYEDKFKISSDTEYCFIKYRDLYKIYFTKKYTYLYVDNTHAYIVDNSKFYYGISDDFNDYFKSKYKYKFKDVSDAN